MNWFWLVAAGATLLLLIRKKDTVEKMPTIDESELMTETGQRVEVVSDGGPAGVETADYLEIVPAQIYWSDAFLQEVYDRMNSFAARVGASDLSIYLQKATGLRYVGKLLTNGEYWPNGSVYPLDVAALAYDQQRPPFWS